MQQPEHASSSGESLLGTRHRPSGLNSRFSGRHLKFEDYIAHTRQMLAAARADRGADDFEKILDGNAPFELKPNGDYPRGKGKPYRRGVLLTHGLTDSPYSMRSLASFFQQNGFRVMAVLLPGHGSRPGDLLEVHWREWAKAVAYGVEHLAAEAEEIYLGGLSCGAALSVHQSLHDDRVRGLFLFSPALRITPRARWANLHKLYSWANPAAQWLDVLPDRDIYKYESFAKNGAAQMFALTQAVAAGLKGPALEIPVFAVASRDDVSVDESATVELMAQARHPASKLVLYTTDVKDVPHGIRADRVELVNSALPDQRILSSAHTGIVVPPEDEHYGRNGTYCNCNHYFAHDVEKYHACVNGQGSVWLGEVTERNLQAGTLRRLTYNPHFAAMTSSLKRFIEDVTG